MRNRGKYQRTSGPSMSLGKVILVGIIILLAVTVCFLTMPRATAEREDIVIGNWYIDSVYIDGELYDIEFFAPYMPGAADMSIEFLGDFSAKINYDGKITNTTWELAGVEEECRVYSFGGMFAVIDTNSDSPVYEYLSVSADDSDTLLMLTKK